MLEQILRQELLEGFPDIALLLFGFDISTKALLLLADTAFDNLFNAIKSTAADKENVRGINLDKLLMGVLAPALRRNGSHRAFQNLQKGLLYTFARYITGDGNILTLLCDLIDLINIDNTKLSLADIIFSSLDQLQKDVLHILSHISCLCQCGGICNCKGYSQYTSQCLRQKGLTGTCRSKH